MENYAKYSKQGILEEYVKADFNGLLTRPDEKANSYSTLANWSNDIGIELVQKRWETAISMLGQMKSNPKAEGLVADIKANLSHCVEAALRDIDSKDENWDREHSWAQRVNKREVFENAKINLEII